MSITLIRNIVNPGVEEIEYLDWVIAAITLSRSIKEGFFKDNKKYGVYDEIKQYEPAEYHNGVTWHTDKLCVSLITIYPIMHGIRNFFGNDGIFYIPDIHAAVSDASYMCNYREAKGKLVWLKPMSEIKMHEVIDIVSSLTPADYSVYYETEE